LLLAVQVHLVHQRLYPGRLVVLPDTEPSRSHAVTKCGAARCIVIALSPFKKRNKIQIGFQIASREKFGLVT
jgi:hypothetical protein